MATGHGCRISLTEVFHRDGALLFAENSQVKELFGYEGAELVTETG
jgi:hypothetical protein